VNYKIFALEAKKIRLEEGIEDAKGGRSLMKGIGRN